MKSLQGRLLLALLWPELELWYHTAAKSHPLSPKANGQLAPDAMKITGFQVQYVFNSSET